MGRPYPVFKAKHLRMLSLIRKSYSDDQLVDFLHLHLHQPTEYVRKAGCPIELLGSNIPRYIQILADRERAKQNAIETGGEYERRKRASVDWGDD